MQVIDVFWCFDYQCYVIVVLFQGCYFVVLVQIDCRQILDMIDQIGFGVILLEVDEGWLFVVVFGQEIELIELGVVVEDLFDVLYDVFFDYVIVDVKLVLVFQ